MNNFTRFLVPALIGAALLCPGEAPAQHRGSSHHSQTTTGHRSASGRTTSTPRTSNRPSTRSSSTRPSNRPSTRPASRPSTRPEKSKMPHSTISTQRATVSPQKKLSTTPQHRTQATRSGIISTTAPVRGEGTRPGRGNNGHGNNNGDRGYGNNKGYGHGQDNGYGKGHNKHEGNSYDRNYKGGKHHEGGRHHGDYNYSSDRPGRGHGHDYYHGGTSAPRPGAWASAPRPHYEYRHPGYRPPRPGGGYWNAPRPNPCRIHYWVPPVPRYVRVLPTVPTIGTVLGLTFGSFIDAGINTLFNSGYNISGYYDNIIYLNNVRLLGCMWPEVMVHYDDGLMCGTQFYNWTSMPDQAMYYNIYGQLSARYGAPVEITYSGGGPTATWWAGGNTGYITLSYGYGASASGMNNYYTSLTYSAY